MSEELIAIASIPEETTPEKRLQRAQRQQAMLAMMCVDAAEEKWPGFNDLVTRCMQEEREALAAMGPTA